MENIEVKKKALNCECGESCPGCEPCRNGGYCTCCNCGEDCKCCSGCKGGTGCVCPPGECKCCKHCPGQ